MHSVQTRESSTACAMTEVHSREALQSRALSLTCREGRHALRRHVPQTFAQPLRDSRRLKRPGPDRTERSHFSRKCSSLPNSPAAAAAAAVARPRGSRLLQPNVRVERGACLTREGRKRPRAREMASPAMPTRGVRRSYLCKSPIVPATSAAGRVWQLRCHPGLAKE